MRADQPVRIRGDVPIEQSNPDPLEHDTEATGSCPAMRRAFRRRAASLAVQAMVVRQSGRRCNEGSRFIDGLTFWDVTLTPLPFCS